MQRFRMVELNGQDRDIPCYFVDETAELVDMAIFARNCFREANVEGINN
jgi:hypothetical protein